MSRTFSSVSICVPSTNRATTTLKANKTRPATRVFAQTLSADPGGRYVLRLYVAGATPRSRQALRHIYQLCEAELKDNYDLEVIDVYQQPELARENQIVATPTLVKEFPRPVRRFFGNMLSATNLFGDLSGIEKSKATP